MVEFGKRQPDASRQPAVPQDKKPIDPYEHMKLLRGLRDDTLDGLLDNWEDIRARQDAGHGVPIADPKRLDELFGHINDRLTNMGKLPLKRFEDLP